MKWTGDNFRELYKFCSNISVENEQKELRVHTLEDGDGNQIQHIASKGDYIIKGVEGEFYPCKPDIFKKTYWTEAEYAQSKEQ